MTHCVRRSRAFAGHRTVTGPVTPTCLHDRWGRVEAVQTALGEALVMRRRTRVRFPPPPPPLLCTRAPVGSPPGALVRSGPDDGGESGSPHRPDVAGSRSARDASAFARRTAATLHPAVR